MDCPALPFLIKALSVLSCIFVFMAHWLVKSEPSAYSWEQFEEDKQTFWNGVRNYGARNNLRAMKKGEEIFFYHSNEGMEIVGIAQVVKEAYQDPTTEEDAWVVVDLKPVRRLMNPVSLAQVKAEPRLADMALVRLSRLSVTPVTDKEWAVVLEMAGEK
jgi:predicted RNA-binding protein with PUA-like domain